MGYLSTIGKIKYPERVMQIKGYYLLWDETRALCTVARCNSDEMADEIAKYCFGKNAMWFNVFTNNVESVLIAVDKLRELKIEQGYINDKNIPVKYRTRKELISEILLEL